jgi:hypothetical protein
MDKGWLRARSKTPRHNIGWIENKIQQHTKLKRHEREKTPITNYIINIKYYDSS